MDELDGLVALAGRVKAALADPQRTISTAESCTGGLLGHVLTEIPGISPHYAGGIVSYSDALKEAELGVSGHVLRRHGAVSAQACVAMAAGARRRYGTDVAVAITGIAGPDGGTPGKPVGLTYVAVADADGSDVRRHLWHGDRHANKVASARAALELLVERLGAA